MNFKDIDQKRLLPLKLTDNQKRVKEALSKVETKKFPISKWYIGALCALDDNRSSERVVHAAHSLREIVEKLRMIIQGVSSYEKIEKVKGKEEKAKELIRAGDPLFDQHRKTTKISRVNELVSLENNLIATSHHSHDSGYIGKYLKQFEGIILDLFSDDTVENQKKIIRILKNPNASKPEVEQLFQLVESKGTNLILFFKQITKNKKTEWLHILEKRGYFIDPPTMFWWPTHYLSSIASHAPDEVVRVVEKIPVIDNHMICSNIVDIALQLDGNRSVKLLPKLIKYIDASSELTGKYKELLVYWTTKGEVDTALRLFKELVRIPPRDPNKISHQKPYSKETVKLVSTLRNPLSQMDSWQLQELLEGVYPLAEAKPFEIARVLARVVYRMIELHKNEYGQDYSDTEFWCRSLRKDEGEHEGIREALVHTLTYACEQVYEKQTDRIVDLDRYLCKQKWKLFVRLRLYLYKKFPSEKNKLSIQKMILGHKTYGRLPFSDDFWQMINNACHHFGKLLLKQEEVNKILDAIMQGPSKQDFAGWTIGEFTEDEFLEYKDGICRSQLLAFEPLLLSNKSLDKYKKLLHKLTKSFKGESSKIVSFSHATRRDSPFSRSPYSLEELKDFSDKELLDCINEWDSEKHKRDGDFIVTVNIDGFAQKFQDFFKTTIAKDYDKLKFWMKNRKEIKHPIYVAAIIKSMCKIVEEGEDAEKFDHLGEWLTLSEWVLVYTNQEYGHSDSHDRQVEHSDWMSARRSVCDLIDGYLKKKIKADSSNRKQIRKILEMLCTQSDSTLDQIGLERPDQESLMDVAINNTRSCALRVLVDSALLAKRHRLRSEVSTAKTILAKRFTSDALHPLTLPEYAILGMLYPYVYNLDKKWATEYKRYFFPQNDLLMWLAAFEGLVGYNHPSSTVFKILRDDFAFSLKHLDKMDKKDPSGKILIDQLGVDLFIYYIWELYPLKGNKSLLEQFYQQASRNCWKSLFAAAGKCLQRIDSPLRGRMKNLVISFFNWRYDVGDREELEGFLSWLEANHLETAWKLSACSQVLDICKLKGNAVYIWTWMLHKALPNYTDKVVECFAKLVKDVNISNTPHIGKQHAKDILMAGLKSNNRNTQLQANQATQQLFDGGLIDASDMEGG